MKEKSKTLSNLDTTIKSDEKNNRSSFKVNNNILYLTNNQQSKSQFQLIIEDQMKRNEYDYNKMMDDFDHIDVKRYLMV